MKLTFELRYETGDGKPLAVTWDSETGTVTGPGAVDVRASLDSALRVGRACLYPPPASYDISDPYHRPDEFAAVIGSVWRVPPELREFYPVVDDMDDTIYAVEEDGTETPAGKVVF